MLPDSPDSMQANEWYKIKKWFQTVYRCFFNIDFGQYNFLNNKYSVGNISGQMILVTFTLANTEKSIAHLLNRVPQGYMVFQKTVACDVYQMFNSGTAWTNKNIFLKCTQATTILLFVF